MLVDGERPFACTLQPTTIAAIVEYPTPTILLMIETYRDRMSRQIIKNAGSESLTIVNDLNPIQKSPVRMTGLFFYHS